MILDVREESVPLLASDATGCVVTPVITAGDVRSRILPVPLLLPIIPLILIPLLLLLLLDVRGASKCVDGSAMMIRYGLRRMPMEKDMDGWWQGAVQRNRRVRYCDSNWWNQSK